MSPHQRRFGWIREPRRGRGRHMSPRMRDEAGIAAFELVAVAVVFVVALLLAVGMGRLGHARQQVESVAADAARAASLERNTGQSAGAARSAAAASLGKAGLSCSRLQVRVDLGNYQPGGQVTVWVACTAALSDVTLAGFPGSHDFTAESTVPIEFWRSS